MLVLLVMQGCAVLHHEKKGDVDYPQIVTMFCLFASCTRAFSPDREPDILYIRCIASICNVVRKDTATAAPSSTSQGAGSGGPASPHPAPDR